MEAEIQLKRHPFLEVRGPSLLTDRNETYTFVALAFEVRGVKLGTIGSRDTG